MAKILSIKDLHVDVASTPIINGLNLEIESGETHAIMGPNGSGKSTLAKTCLLYTSPSPRDRG